MAPPRAARYAGDTENRGFVRPEGVGDVCFFHACVRKYKPAVNKNGTRIARNANREKRTCQNPVAINQAASRAMRSPNRSRVSRKTNSTVNVPTTAEQNRTPN